MTGRRGLPPLWLRRHTGPLGSYDTATADMLRLIDQLALVEPGNRVLDVGCGAGAMVPGLLDRAGSEGSYVGFDVHGPSVEWCRRRYRDERRCQFEVAYLASPYATEDGGRVEEYTFPIGKGQADFVLAKSVFTHLLPAEAERYLREAHRALRPGRPAIVTVFLFAPDSRTGAGKSRFFRGSEPTGRVRWRSRFRPQSAVAYERDYFFGLVERAGLRVQWMSPGYFPGDADSLSAQDVLILGH